jgi:hypothetical protein
MRCWRFGIRRQFVPFLEDALAPGPRTRVELHLRACGRCRDELARIREGHREARKLPHLGGENLRVLPSSKPMREGGGNGLIRRGKWTQGWENRFAMAATPRTIGFLAGLVLVLAALLVASNREVLFGYENTIMARAGALNHRDFQLVPLPEIQTNTRPRIATEGYVSEVRIDDEEKILHFKLSEIPEGTGPFVVCEVMNPSAKKRLREGSRVRVYGVARFDAQPGREWHEVNPVFDISVLKN